jgi:FdrA protein
MVILTRVRPSEYHDSITLMQAAAAALGLPGVEDAAVVMGTRANHDILAGAGLLTPEAAASRADELVIVVKAQDEAAAQAGIARAFGALAERAPATEANAVRPKSLASAIAAAPGANLAVISVAGRYAAAEARAALEKELHVLLFSDNVTVEDEINLKELAIARGLLCMGPDAGTAIINGVALGFADAVPRGSVGLVSAAGTGLQAVTCGLARRGAGVSQAIGTGGRDLSEAVSGRMMLHALKMLQDDPDTHVIVLISKPPAPSVAEKVLTAVKMSGAVGDRPQLTDRAGRSPTEPAGLRKPTVICFLGAEPGPIEQAGAIPTTTLAQAAAIAAALAQGGDYCTPLVKMEEDSKALIPLAATERAQLAPGQHHLRGLFAGGTFCYEAQLILRSLPEPVHSNAPLVALSVAEPLSKAEVPSRTEPGHRLADSSASVGHTIIDLGADEFTQGRLHPMIDPALRNRRIVQEARDPSTAVILLDFVLGYGSHPDPAGAALDAIHEAQHLAADAGRHIVFVASVCGTEADPQRLSVQEAGLRDAGVLVLPDNASAARLAGLIVT